MYIRVKRHKTTYFIQCDPTETTSDIKQKLQVLIDQPSNNQRLTLVATSDILDDSKTLAEQKVENDAIVALALRKDDNEFEEVYVAKAGWQSLVAFINITCYYLIGLPIGAVLGFILKLNALGIWLGMLGGFLLQTVILLLITIRTKWQRGFTS